MSRCRVSTLRQVVHQFEGVAPSPAVTYARHIHQTDSVLATALPVLFAFPNVRSINHLQPSAKHATIVNVAHIRDGPSHAAYIADVQKFWEDCKRDLKNASLAVGCITKRLLPGARLSPVPVDVPITTSSANDVSVEHDFSSLQSIADSVAGYVARRITPSHQLLATVTEATVSRVQHGFDADAVATILQGLVLFGCHPNKTDIAVLCKSVKCNAEKCSPLASISILCALSSFQYRDEELLHCLCQQLIGQVNLLDAESLPQILWFCSTLRYSNPRLVDVVVAKALWEVNQLSPKSLAQIVVSLATLRHRDAMTNVLLDAVAETALKRLSSFTNGDLADLCWGYAELEHRGPLEFKLFDAVLRRMMIAHQELDSNGIVNLLWSVAKLDYQNSDTPHLLDWLATSIKSILSAFNTNQLVDLLWALSKLRYYDSDLYQEFAVRIAADIDQVTGRHVADLLFSYANVNYKPGLLLDIMVSKALSSLEEMQGKDMCNTLWSLAMLDRLPAELFDKISACLASKRLEDLKPQHLQRAFQAQLLVQSASDRTPTPSLPDWLEYPARKCWEDHMYFASHVTRTQQEVMLALSQIGFRCEMEKLVEEGLFVVDIKVDVPGFDKVAVEVDESNCFSCNKPYTPLGTALFARKFLLSRGWHVVSVSKHKWVEQGERKLEFLKGLLQQVGKPMGAVQHTKPQIADAKPQRYAWAAASWGF